MQPERPPSPSLGRIEDMLLEGLSPATQDLLLQLLLYKTIFMGAPFRALAVREDPPELRALLTKLHADSAAEAAGLTLTMRQWDAHPGGTEGISEYAAEVRRRFLIDVIALKESVVDLGLGAAMRAPTKELRDRFLVLNDVDRKHANMLRAHIGARTVAQHLPPRESEAGSAGAASGREAREPMQAAIRRMLDDLLRRGAMPSVLIVSPDGARHLRDENAIDPDTGRAFGLLVEVDLGWRGDCFAIETLERIGYAELLTAAKSPASTEAGGGTG